MPEAAKDANAANFIYWLPLATREFRRNSATSEAADMAVTAKRKSWPPRRRFTFKALNALKLLR